VIAAVKKKKAYMVSCPPQKKVVKQFISLLYEKKGLCCPHKTVISHTHVTPKNNNANTAV